MLQRLWLVDDLDDAADHEVVSPDPGAGSLPGGTLEAIRGPWKRVGTIGT